MNLKNIIAVAPRFFSGNLQRWLLLSAGFSGLLLLARVIITGTPVYVFLAWNLFLAYIPCRVTSGLVKNNRNNRNGVKPVLAVLVCLLFIPNSFYIITDLVHLTHVKSAPAWFDLLMVFSFAWNGILFGIISLSRVETLLSRMLGQPLAGIVFCALMGLNALGIYLGRVLRFNSWDVFTNPFSLLDEMTGLFLHPFRNSMAWGMVACYSVFMILLYFTIKKLGDIFRTAP